MSSEGTSSPSDSTNNSARCTPAASTTNSAAPSPRYGSASGTRAATAAMHQHHETRSSRRLSVHTHADEGEDDDDDEEDEDGCESDDNGAPTPSNTKRGTSSSSRRVASSDSKMKRGHGSSCHQCKTTKESQYLFFCTNKAQKGVRKRRCRKKYCETCLKRSYAPEMSEVVPQWQCPSCLGLCICAACHRKSTKRALGVGVGSNATATMTTNVNTSSAAGGNSSSPNSHAGSSPCGTSVSSPSASSGGSESGIEVGLGLGVEVKPAMPVTPAIITSPSAHVPITPSPGSNKRTIAHAHAHAHATPAVQIKTQATKADASPRHHLKLNHATIATAIPAQSLYPPQAPMGSPFVFSMASPNPSQVGMGMGMGMGMNMGMGIGMGMQSPAGSTYSLNTYPNPEGSNVVSWQEWDQNMQQQQQQGQNTMQPSQYGSSGSMNNNVPINMSMNMNYRNYQERSDEEQSAVAFDTSASYSSDRGGDDDSECASQPRMVMMPYGPVIHQSQSHMYGYQQQQHQYHASHTPLSPSSDLSSPLHRLSASSSQSDLLRHAAMMERHAAAAAAAGGQQDVGVGVGGSLSVPSKSRSISAGSTRLSMSPLTISRGISEEQQQYPHGMQSLSLPTTARGSPRYSPRTMSRKSAASAASTQSDRGDSMVLDANTQRHQAELEKLMVGMSPSERATFVQEAAALAQQQQQQMMVGGSKSASQSATSSPHLSPRTANKRKLSATMSSTSSGTSGGNHVDSDLSEPNQHVKHQMVQRLKQSIATGNNNNEPMSPPHSIKSEQSTPRLQELSIRIKHDDVAAQQQTSAMSSSNMMNARRSMPANMPPPLPRLTVLMGMEKPPQPQQQPSQHPYGSMNAGGMTPLYPSSVGGFLSPFPMSFGTQSPTIGHSQQHLGGRELSAVTSGLMSPLTSTATTTTSSATSSCSMEQMVASSLFTPAPVSTSSATGGQQARGQKSQSQPHQQDYLQWGAHTNTAINTGSSTSNSNSNANSHSSGSNTGSRGGPLSPAPLPPAPPSLHLFSPLPGSLSLNFPPTTPGAAGLSATSMLMASPNPATSPPLPTGSPAPHTSRRHQQQMSYGGQGQGRGSSSSSMSMGLGLDLHSAAFTSPSSALFSPGSASPNPFGAALVYPSSMIPQQFLSADGRQTSTNSTATNFNLHASGSCDKEVNRMFHVDIGRQISGHNVNMNSPNPLVAT